MAHRTFLALLLLVVADCLSFDKPRIATERQYDELGYFVKKENDSGRTRQSSVLGTTRKIEFTSGGLVRDDLEGRTVLVSLGPRGRPSENVSVGREQEPDGYDELGYFLKTAKQENDSGRARQNTVTGAAKKNVFTSGGQVRDDSEGRTVASSLGPRERPSENVSVGREHQRDGSDELAYFLKTAKQENDSERERQNAVMGETKKNKFTSGGTGRDDMDRKPIVDNLSLREGPSEDVSLERQKNDSAVPLHVMGLARKPCMEGHGLDANGNCQKLLPPREEKSFSLRRRKREQLQPKLSYADVVKYGKNPPLTTPFKAEILTTTPSTVLKKEERPVVTTIKPTPSEAPKITTPTIAGKIAEAASTLLTTVHKNLPETTTAASVKPTVVSQPAITTPAVKATVHDVVTSQTAKPTVSGVATTVSGVTTVTPVNKAGVTTAPTTVKPIAAATSPTPTRRSGLIIPTLISKIPGRVKSVLGDLNKAFLSGEKASIAKESTDIKPAAGTSDTTRLRRWIRMI